MTFQAILEQAAGKNATGITVPKDVIKRLGAGKRPHVSVTIKHFTFETTIGVMDGESKISVSAERRQAAGVNPGDKLMVNVSLT